MTSSLVGSEMCIRDSVRRSLWLRTEMPLISLDMEKGEVCLHQQVHHVIGCLLYTSDAADDM
eukprot:11125419-Prorocentrum_lima.AAC.1